MKHIILIAALILSTPALAHHPEQDRFESQLRDLTKQYRQDPEEERLRDMERQLQQQRIRQHRQKMLREQRRRERYFDRYDCTRTATC